MKELLFSSIYNLSPQMIVITNQKDATIKMANPVFGEILGFTEDEYMYRSTIELGIWPNPEERVALVKELTDNGIVRNKEVTLKTKNGRLLNCYFSATPMTYDSQDCLIAIVIDITEQKKAEQAYRDSEFRFRSIVENLPVAISIADLSGNIHYLNPTFFNYFGYTLTDIPNIEIWARLAYRNPQYREHCIDTWRNDIIDIKKGKATFSSPRVYQIYSKSNQLLDVEIIFTIFGSDVYTIFTDITEKVKAEIKLKSSEQKFVNIFNLSPDMVGITSISEGVVVDCNSELTKITGFTRDECIGKTTKELGWWSNYDDRATMLKLLEEHGVVQNLEIKMHIKNGSILTCLFSCNKIIIDDEECLLFVVHDISDRKVAEDKLKRSEERLKKAQNVGHIGYAEQIIGEPELWASSEAMKIFGFSTEEGYIAFSKVKACICDYDFFRTSYFNLVEQGEKFDIEFAINPADGSAQRYVRQVTDIEKNEERRPYKLLSIIQDITDRKKAEEALQKRVIALTKPLGDPESVNFTDLFDIEDLQQLQDAFSNATGVASIITQPDGTPITKTSNFCRLCNMIRQTEKGKLNCQKSDAIIGKQNIYGPIIQPCLSGGLWDAGAGITVGGKHIANWLIGQVRNESQDEKKILAYANEIGISRDQFKLALEEVPSMSKEQFEKISQALFILAKQLSVKAYQNIQQARFIAEQQKAEEALRESESNYRDVFNASSDAMFIHEMPSGKVIDVNDAMLKIYGYSSKEEVLMAGTHSFTNNDPHYSLEKAMEKLRLANEVGPQTFEWMIQHNKTQECRWGEVSLIRSNISGSNRIVASVRDITERKKNESVLLEKEAKIRSIFTAAPVGISLIIDRIFHECNDAFYSITGYTPDEIIGKNTRLLYATEEDYILTGEVPIPDIKETGLESFETIWRRKDGKNINVLLNYIAIDPNELSKGYIFTILDITERKQVEMQIKHINAKLEERVTQRTVQLEKANKDLEAFAYSVSHDLRAPLRHVDGFIRLMYSNIESPSEIITNYFEKINSASKRMSRMIDDLLSFSRLGRRELVETDVDLNPLFQEIIDQFKPDISNRDVVWEIAPLPHIRGDKNLLYLAFANIVSNAIKYTSTKQKAIISVGVSRCSPKEVEVYVKDNGVGFDMNYIDKLFGVFQRLHSAEEFEGTGIGLANVKQIINKHGGTIRAEAKIDEGAIFFISLPK